MTARRRIPSILTATAFAGLMLACGGDGPAAPSPDPAAGPSEVFDYTSARTLTNAAGQYVVAGMCSGETYLFASKVGYSSDRGQSECDGDCIVVNITGNTRLDVSLVRLP